MENPASTQFAQREPAPDLPGTVRDVAQWWEPRRVTYNLILAAVFAGLTARTWPRLRPELTREAVLPLIVLALLANLCYSVAYLVDLAALSAPAPRHRNTWRWVLWSAGMLFAMLLETYWFLDEILPPTR